MAGRTSGDDDCEHRAGLIALTSPSNQGLMGCNPHRQTETETQPIMTNATATRTPAIDAAITAEILTLTFSNGEVITLSSDQLTPEIRQNALMHGLKQKLVDAAAMSRNTDTGQSATIQDKYDAVREVYGRLLAGEWNKRREGTETGSLLLRALIVMKPEKTREQLETYLAGLTKAQQAALRANPKVAEVIAQMRAKPAANVDTDAMLDAI